MKQADCVAVFGDDVIQSDKRVQIGGERETGLMPVTQDRPVDCSNWRICKSFKALREDFVG